MLQAQEASSLTREEINSVVDRWLRKLEVNSVYSGVTDRPSGLIIDGLVIEAAIAYVPTEGGPEKRWIGVKGDEIWEGDIYRSGKVEPLGQLPVGWSRCPF